MDTQFKDAKKNFKYRLLIFIALVATNFLFLPKEKISEYQSWKIGSIATRKVISPYDYEILKTEEELKRDRKKVKLSILPIFTYNDTLLASQYKIYRSFSKDLDSLYSFKKKSENLLKEIIKLKQKQDLLTDKPNELNALNKKFNLKDSIYNSLRSDFSKNKLLFQQVYNINFDNLDENIIFDKEIRKKIRYFLRSYIHKKIYNIPLEKIMNNSLGKVVIVSKGKRDTFALDRFPDILQFHSQSREFIEKNLEKEIQDSLGSYVTILKRFIVPNLIFDRALVDAEILQWQNGVPLAKGLVKKGEEIVDKNMVINEPVKEKLNSLSQKEKELSVREDRREFLSLDRALNLLGKIFYAAIPYIILFIVLFFDRKRVYYKTKKMILLGLIILLQLILVFFMTKSQLFDSEYLILISITGILLSAFFDNRVALIAIFSISLSISTIKGSSFSYFIIPLLPGVFSVYSSSNFRDRYQLFIRPFFIIFFGYVLLATSFNFLNIAGEEMFSKSLIEGAINAFISPFVAFGLVAIFERIFKFPTDLTYLELSDMTKPLLKRMQAEVPGTYHHSLAVGNLAEKATEAIGGNSLLARVGAYYHDIGKLSKPEYFIENQQYMGNKHNNLPPHMSALILKNHVKEGVRLGKEYKLPLTIIDFIKTHHGTSTIQYFYHKALENSREDEKVDKRFYQYSGPKPQTKEQAIVMLSDIIEAKCRAIDTPEYEVYRKAINEVFQYKIQEGELEECNLKLQELTIIKEAMLQVILGMYHKRIKYPSQKTKD